MNFFYRQFKRYAFLALLTLLMACGNTQSINGEKFTLNNQQSVVVLNIPQFNVQNTSFVWSYGINLYWSDNNPEKDMLIVQRKTASTPDFVDVKTYYYGPQQDFFYAPSSSYPSSSNHYLAHGTQYTYRIKVVQGEHNIYSQEYTLLFDPFAQAPTKPIITNLEDYSYGTHCVVELAWMDADQNETAYSIEKVVYFADGTSQSSSSSVIPEITDIMETGERIIYETLPDFIIGVDYRLRAENPQNVSEWSTWRHLSGFNCG
ncbi:hypothetical protein MRY82_04870 [bacterium]|nr:hypothetical protein [bacterium]